jgi:hypothetical protein
VSEGEDRWHRDIGNQGLYCRVQDSLLREVRFPDTTREIIEDHSVGAKTSDKGVEE